MTIINRINAMLARRGWLPYVLVVGLYCLMRLPDVLVVVNYSALVNPLLFSYVTRLLFDGLTVRPDIALTVIGPSNISLVAPPGLYALNAIAGKVSGIYWTLFVFQLAVCPLFYRLMSKVLPRSGALLLALLATYYFTRTNWWTADFLIQPLMLLGVLLLLSPQFRRGAASLIVLGQIAGLVIVFKHNIGVFFSILCGTWLFLGAFSPIENSFQPNRLKPVVILLTGFFAFIPVFGMRLLFWDEWLFYLLPYAAFWVMFVIFLRQGLLAFDLPRFLKNSVVFSVSALLLPGLVFMAFGSVIGYGRYWHSLFGMGFKFLHLWDQGIIHTIWKFMRGGGLANIYDSFVLAGLYFLPWVANLFAVWCVGITLFSSQWSVRRKLALFRIASLGVMGIFMFFPLESYHILSTKLFLFVFVAAYFLRRFYSGGMSRIGYVLALMLLPVFALGGYRVVSALKMETEPGSPILQRMIGVPLQKEIATELDRQVEVIKRSVQGRPYYVIDSALVVLATLVDNRLPQYYIEMRPGILDGAAVEAIKADLIKREYVIVQTDQYARRNDVDMDHDLREIINFVDAHYVMTDSYTKPITGSDKISQIQNFLVMRRR